MRLNYSSCRVAQYQFKLKSKQRHAFLWTQVDSLDYVTLKASDPGIFVVNRHHATHIKGLCHDTLIDTLEGPLEGF